MATKVEAVPVEGQWGPEHKEIKIRKFCRVQPETGEKERRLPISIIVVPANENDSTLYTPTLKNFKIKRPKGRPVNSPSRVTADAIYDTDNIKNIIGGKK